MVIRFFASLRLPGVGSQVVLSVRPDATVGDVLQLLFDQAPIMRAQLMAPETQDLLPHINIMLQGRLIRDLQGLATKVAGADSLAIFPPVAGG